MKSRCMHFAAAFAVSAKSVCMAADVFVSLDLDTASPGRQPTVIGLPGNGVIHAAVSIHDPSASHSLFSIGYLGGLDRGISCGYVINPETHGEIVTFAATPGTPANPGNTPWTFDAFAGNLGDRTTKGFLPGTG